MMTRARKLEAIRNVKKADKSVQCNLANLANISLLTGDDTPGCSECNNVQGMEGNVSTAASVPSAGDQSASSEPSAGNQIASSIPEYTPIVVDLTTDQELSINLGTATTSSVPSVNTCTSQAETPPVKNSNNTSTVLGSPIIISDDEDVSQSVPSQTSSTSKIDKWICPICFDPATGQDVCSTVCGHKFCEECILTHLQNYRRCPSCGIYLDESYLITLFNFNQ